MTSSEVDPADLASFGCCNEVPAAQPALKNSEPSMGAAKRRLTRQTRLRLKFELLAHGLAIPNEVLDLFERREWKPPLRTRSGASGGLDLLIDHDLYVNVPVNHPGGPRTACWELAVVEGDSLELRSKVDAVQALGLPRPGYYHDTLPSGIRTVRVGQQCSADRICIGLVPGCYFWKRERRCTFCSIGENARNEAAEKTPENVAAAVATAHTDPCLPARHVLLGGGTPKEADYGAARLARLCRAIKERCDVPVYAMLVPSKDLDDVQRLYDAGVDELGYNLEFYSEVAALEFMPGKHSLVGRKWYVRMLEEAARVFGPVASRSLLVVGLESFDCSLNGVKLLCDLGVMPILSPFRSLVGTDLENHVGWEASEFIDFYKQSLEIARSAGLPLGPTCIPCQNNTLAIPEDDILSQVVD